MRAFRFRLERILNLRDAEKQQRAWELAEQRRQFDIEQERLREELQGREDMTNAYRHLGRHVTSAGSWMSTRDAVQATEMRVANQARVTKIALGDVEKARERLMEKSREVKTYHRLRDKQRQEHELLARRAEQKAHDDTAVDRYLQKQREQKSK